MHITYIGIICNAFGAKSGCAATCFSSNFEKVIRIHVIAQKQGLKALHLSTAYPLFWRSEYPHTGVYKMHHKTCCAVTGIRTKMSTIEGSLGHLISLLILLLCAIIALAIISRIIRLISPHPQTIKNSPKFSANFLHLL